MVLLAKTKLNTMEVLISKALIDSDISQNQLVLVAGLLKEYNHMKQAFKNLDNGKYVDRKSR